MFKKSGTKVSVIQTLIKQGETDDNWQRARQLVHQAKTQKPKLIVLPQAFRTGVNFIILRKMAQKIPGSEAFDQLSALAAESGAHLVAGMLELGDDDHIYDTALLFDPKGALLHKYRRRFRWVGERNYISAGDRPEVVDTDLGRIALIVGYDLCFPQTTQDLLREDVDMIVCPASIFRELNVNAAHLAMARAMDAHCYLLYANAVGFHQFANMHYTGSSLICGDPYFLQVQMKQKVTDDLGLLARAAADREMVLHAELHLADLAKARKNKLPFRGDAEDALASTPTAALN